MATILVTTRDFIDADMKFIKHPLTNQLAVKKGVNAVKQSIAHLLQLKSGDIPFHPEIKSPIYSLFFENSSSAEKVILESEVEKYLGAYEPRFVVDTVVISFPEPNSVNCELSGTIINISTPVTINILVERLR